LLGSHILNWAAPGATAVGIAARGYGNERLATKNAVAALDEAAACAEF